MENATEALYIGVYTMIFVISLTLTIFLFSSMMDYSENAYKFMNNSSSDAVLVNVPANRHLLINGQQVMSYYYNYIAKDRFIDKNTNTNYKVNINLHTKNDTPLWLDTNDLTYKDLEKKVGLNEQYIVSVDQNTKTNQIVINIVKATPEEILEEW